MANHNKRKQHINNGPRELEANARKRRKARENACDHVTIGFSLASDWLKKGPRVFQTAITGRSKAKQNQSKRISVLSPLN